MALCFRVLCITLFIFAATQIGESIKCYHCVDSLGGNCDVPLSNKVEKKECGEPEAVCYIRNVTALNSTGIVQNGTVSRGCGHKGICDLRAMNVTHNVGCNTCETDLCNSATNILPTVLIVGVVAVIFAKQFA